MSVFDEKRLRARLGVRGPGLLGIRGSELGALLHVAPSDDAGVVLLKVLHQLDRAIPEVVEKEWDAAVIGYSCNAPRDAQLNRLDNQEKRLSLLEDRGGPARRSADKRTAYLTARLAKHWRDRPPEPPTTAELDHLRRLEEEYRLTGMGTTTVEVGPNHLTKLIETWNTSGRDEIEDWLEQWVLHFEIVGGYLVTTRTADSGEYLCVFTSPQRLAEYQRHAPGGPPATADRALGRTLLGLAVSSGVGLVVDPVVGGLGSTYWSAGEVARRWARGE